MSIDAILGSFERFGINLGLERITELMVRLNNPHYQVPVLHIAGTNGKGSVCAYLSSVLTEAGYRVGRYISPHLVDWTERICINGVPIDNRDLQIVLQDVIGAISSDELLPTQFEVITAAAWLYFAREKVDVAVIEVGLGGRLDATNVIDQPLVSVITSLSREHWQRLGPTLADIAREKAGILKRGCPAVVGPLPPEARKVVNDRLLTLGCPTTWVEPAQLLKSDPFHPVASYGNFQYILPMPGQVQLLNSAIAIAVLESLKQQGWAISDTAIVEGIAKTRWPGRLQWISCHDNRSFLLDGAHNPAAAAALREYVDELQQRGTVDGPITWVMGMLSTKDHDDIFRALLHSGDRLHLVPVPDHSSAIPEQLAHLAHQICPQLGSCQTHSDPIVGLETALANSDNSLVVLCGSLYLVGYILKAVSSGGGGH